MLLRAACALLALVGAAGHDAAGAETHEHGAREMDGKHAAEARKDVASKTTAHAHVHAHSSEGQFGCGVGLDDVDEAAAIYHETPLETYGTVDAAHAAGFDVEVTTKLLETRQGKIETFSASDPFPGSAAALRYCSGD